MKYDPTNKDTYFFKGEEGMMMQQNQPWVSTGDFGKRDSIGRTFRALYTYGDIDFYLGIMNCWVKEGNKYQAYRYPNYEHNNISRDHLVYSFLAFIHMNMPQYLLKEHAHGVRFKISEVARLTPDTWMWLRAIAGSKFWTKAYLVTQLAMVRLNTAWNKLLYWFNKYGEELPQHDFKMMSNSDKKNKHYKKLYPMYAMHIFAWQLKVLPDSKLKKKVQRLALRMCPRHNYVIQMLLGKFPPEAVLIYNYKPMTNNRWTTVLIPEVNDRWCTVINDYTLIEANALDRDYVVKMYRDMKEEPTK